MEPCLPSELSNRAQAFLDLLDRWNRVHALTALPPEARWEELVLDACALFPFLDPLPAGARVADFGTGMGVPAVILALARPDLEVLALDKARKKIAFVRQVALEMRLENLHPISGRAELLAPMRADLGTAKAVGSLELLAEWWRRHGKPGAPFLALKGDGEEAAPAGFRLESHAYRLPTRGHRTVLVMRASE